MTPTITIDRATVEHALEALENAEDHLAKPYSTDARKAITALRAALAQQAEPVPVPPFPPVSQWNRGCAVCGIGADGRAYAYVCPRSDCPTKVACGGVA